MLILIIFFSAEADCCLHQPSHESHDPHTHEQAKHKTVPSEHGRTFYNRHGITLVVQQMVLTLHPPTPGTFLLTLLHLSSSLY
jgi:hypothetical protein